MSAQQKIIGLRPDISTPADVDQEIVDAIENLMARAKRGDITAFAFVTMNPQGYTNITRIKGREKCATLLGMASALVSQIDEDWRS